MICYPSLCLCAQGRFLFLNAPTIFLEVNTRMPNAKVLSEKQAIVAELTEKIQKASAGVLVDYKGITVEEDTALRRECRENGVDYAVVKNTLLRFAFNNTGLNELDDLLNGTTSLALCEEDVVAPARVMSDYAKKLNDKFEIKGGFMDGKPVSLEPQGAGGVQPERAASLFLPQCAGARSKGTILSRERMAPLDPQENARGVPLDPQYWQFIA